MGKSALKIILTDEALRENRAQEETFHPHHNCAALHNQNVGRTPSRTLSMEDIGRFELKNLLKSCDVPSSPKTSVFGVSPPIRGGRWGGAANPMSMDRNWHVHARYAVQHNLPALTERSKRLKPLSSSSRNLGDPQILVISTDDKAHVGKEDMKKISATESSPTCVPFTCQTRYFTPQKIK